MNCVWLIYVRKSVVRNDTDLESPERQLFVNQARLQIAETEPYEVEIYQDLDRSGSTEEGRSEWLRLKEQLERPEVVGVVASSLDRLYRNVTQFLAFLNEIEQLGKVLITSKESLDTATPLGRFVVTILMALYEMEWRLTSQRMQEMVSYKRLELGRHWGPAPFGCARDDDGHLIPSQEVYELNGESPYLYDSLAECFKLYATNKYTYEKVAIMLNASRWRYVDRYGTTKKWSRASVREVLARWRLYRGELPLGNPRKDKDIQWLQGGHEPILPTELCDNVGQVLKKRTKIQHSRRGKQTQVHLLSDVLHCASCNEKLTGVIDHGLRRYRHQDGLKGCNEKWVDADQIEFEVMQAIVELVQDTQMLSDVRQNLEQLTQPPQDNDIEQFREKMLREKLERLEYIYLDAELDKDSYVKRRANILSQLAQIQVNNQAEDYSGLVDQIVTSIHYIFNADAQTKKALISELIKRLDVTKGAISRFIPKEWALPFLFRVVDGPSGSQAHPTQP